MQILMMLEMAENHSLSMVLHKRGLSTMSIPMYPQIPLADIRGNTMSEAMF